MKRVVFFLFFISALFNGYRLHAATNYVEKWTHAMMNEGAGMNSIITSDFAYKSYSFEFKGRLTKENSGNIPFFSKTSKPTEITVEDREEVPGGEIVTLNVVADAGLYREWEEKLFIASNGITGVTEIAKEGRFEGLPMGCPETAFKRDLVVTLRGQPQGLEGMKIIKLYSFRRETDTLDFALPGADQEALKHCSPKPDTYQLESEVLVFDTNGQLENGSTVAAMHKNEKSDDPSGVTFAADDGVNFPGRMFPLGGESSGLFITFSVDGKGGSYLPAKLFVWRGGWRPVWSFTVGSSEASGPFGGKEGAIEWSLKSEGTGTDDPAIIADLVTNDSPSFKCEDGTKITFRKKGNTFKPEKSGYSSACLKGRTLSDGSLTANLKEDKVPTYHGKVEEIDWLFKR